MSKDFGCMASISEFNMLALALLTHSLPLMMRNNLVPGGPALLKAIKSPNAK